MQISRGIKYGPLLNIQHYSGIKYKGNKLPTQGSNTVEPSIKATQDGGPLKVVVQIFQIKWDKSGLSRGVPLYNNLN